MSILIMPNGKIIMEYPYDELNFKSSEVKVLLTGSEEGTVQAFVLMKPNLPVLKIWFDYEAKYNKTIINKKATLISHRYGQKEVYGKVLIEGDVQIILDELKIVFPYLKLSPKNRKRK